MGSKKNIFPLLFLLFAVTSIQAQSGFSLSSTDHTISVDISLKEKIYYSVLFKGERVLEASPLSINIDNAVLGANPVTFSTKNTSIDGFIPTVWVGRKSIKDQYNQLILNCEGDFSVEFRAYKTGVAYRFVTRLKGKQVIVKNEEVAFRFNSGISAWMLDSKSYESNFRLVLLDVMVINEKSKIFLPIFAKSTLKVKVAITESGLYDYPSLLNKLSSDKVTVSHKVLLPFTRGIQGPMDFTPGGMRNLQSGHNLRNTLPLVHGTRSNEMALYVLYNEPLKMLCDAPSVYEREPEINLENT